MNSSSLNDTSLCHPFLLAQENLSERGLCNDTVSSYVFSAIVLAVHATIVCINMSGLIYKLRKMNHTTTRVNYLTVARSPPLIIIGMFIGLLLTFITTIRVLVGRKNFPCVSVLHVLVISDCACSVHMDFHLLLFSSCHCINSAS